MKNFNFMKDLKILAIDQLNKIKGGYLGEVIPSPPIENDVDD